MAQYEPFTNSPEQRKRIKRVIQNAWNAIAYDVECRNLGEQVEVTLDADYTHAYGRDHEADHWLKECMSYEEQDKIGFEAFGR